LMDARCVVYVANHGEEALQVLKESSVWYEPKPESKKIDIILMDWEMPVMDGLTCSREIRKLEREGKVKERIDIIATTANARDEQIRTALESGIDSVMSKPFLVKDLLTKMREQLGGDRKKPFFFEGG
jgi:CheY-like chemotaxis protein